MNSMDIHEILEYLPHRYPFLLIDRVLACEPGRNINALKNVTINEPFFGGHFPHHPVMPGVLIIEAMAQAAALLESLSPLPPTPMQATRILLFWPRALLMYGNASVAAVAAALVLRKSRRDPPDCFCEAFVSMVAPWE